KVDTEVPATASGILKEILAQNGEVIPVGKPIAIIATDGDESSTSPVVQPAQKEETSNAAAQASIVTKDIKPQPHISNGESSRFYSPLVMNIARQENVTMAELESIKGTGKDERVTKNDILDYIQTRKTSTATSSEKQQVKESVK